jgi:peptide/nickel transport system permease protein
VLQYFLKKTAYGFLVLLGAVTFVFFLFNMAPGDPAREIAGENASLEVVQNIERKYNLDLSIGRRYTLYLNDLSPISIHSKSEESRLFFDTSEYSGFQLISLGSQKGLFLKKPYLMRSYFSDKSVSETLSEVIPGTFVLAVISILLALFFGLILGMLAAVKRDSPYDRFILVVSALGMSGPSFFMAILIGWIGAVLWYDHITVPLFVMIAIGSALLFILVRKSKGAQAGAQAFVLVLSAWLVGILLESVLGIRLAALHYGIELPGTGLPLTGSLYAVDPWEGRTFAPENMILPVITLMIRPLAVIVQLTRSSMLDVLSQDFIRTARAKGLSETKIVLKHALRNALNPVITAVSGWFASLLAGAVFVEFVFGWKGLGQEMFTAIEKQDLPVVMGGVIFISFTFVVINMLVDILYGVVDPRIRS